MNEKNQTLIITLLIIAVVIASIGWYTAAKSSSSVKDQLISACEDLSTSDKRANCGAYLGDLTDLIEKYGQDLRQSQENATASSTNASSTTKATTTQI